MVVGAAALQSVPKGVGGTLPQIRLRLTGGFRPGYLYELICEAEGPIVQGLGFAAVRDLISFLRHDASAKNPLRIDGKPAMARAHGFGVSQSGRFLRNFLYQGFNADEAGRKVFDGLMPHVAGGGLGFFNHRFAQPTRNNGQHEDHLYPTDYFPFTYGDTTDPFTQRTDGILRRTRNENPKLLPKVMHTQSAAEYWHRSGSLVHTTRWGPAMSRCPTTSASTPSAARSTARRPIRPVAASPTTSSIPPTIAPSCAACSTPWTPGHATAPRRRPASIRASTRARWSRSSRKAPASRPCRACVIPR